MPVVGFAGDGAFGISMNEMTSMGREGWPAITMVIFRNYQWGAEKRNSILWYDNNFVGTELNPDLSYARVADACGLKGVAVSTMEELTAALRESCAAQADGVTTFIEVILNQELGEPFRRDAMKAPNIVAGIDGADMRLPIVDIVDRLIERKRNSAAAPSSCPRATMRESFEAARRLHDEGIARPILIGTRAALEDAAAVGRRFARWDRERCAGGKRRARRLRRALPRRPAEGERARGEAPAHEAPVSTPRWR